MGKPTKAQVKEFYELIGLIHKKEKRFDYWYNPLGILVSIMTPSIDLNSLFQYADPVLDKIGEHYIVLQKQWNDPSIKQATVAFVKGNAYEGEGKTYAIALFHALYPILKEAKK